MIQANELRIGNWVLHPKKNDIYFQIKIDMFSFSDGLSNLEDYRPIPLTQEILLKCGFEKDEDGWLHINIKDNSFGMNYENDKWNFYWFNDTPLDCLHQLQNLYFVLTGEELTINL